MFMEEYNFLKLPSQFLSMSNNVNYTNYSGNMKINTVQMATYESFLCVLEFFSYRHSRNHERLKYFLNEKAFKMMQDCQGIAKRNENKPCLAIGSILVFRGKHPFQGTFFFFNPCHLKVEQQP